MYYVYFITPEPESRFVTFGKSRNLGSRWIAYKTAQPDPKIVGLIKCNNRYEMDILEDKIKHNHFQNAKHRGEWLYHTAEVKAFYQEKTNVGINQTLSDALEHHKQKIRDKQMEIRRKEKEREEQKKEQRQKQEQKEREEKEFRRKVYQREYYRKYNRERYQNDPEYKKRSREYQKNYQQRPEVKKRNRQRAQENRAKNRKKRPSSPDTLDLF